MCDCKNLTDSKSFPADGSEREVESPTTFKEALDKIREHQPAPGQAFASDLPRRVIDPKQATMAGVDDRADVLRQQFKSGQADVDLTPVDYDTPIVIQDGEGVDSPSTFADKLKQQLANRPKGKM